MDGWGPIAHMRCVFSTQLVSVSWLNGVDLAAASPRARRPGVQHQVGLRKYPYEQS